jgi:deazaflavin-dependent oxidoreductase (nitroreductase family)
MAESYQAPDITLLGEDHIRAYRETGGATGYLWNGATALLLMTTGAKSGLERTSALIFARDEEGYLVVASQGGAPTHPNWYHNLLAHPEARIQVKDQVIEVVARTASDEERPRLWGIVNEQWPNYETYQERTERRIPVVVLTPRAGTS